MTSYHIDERNRQVADKLPETLRETDYTPIEGMADWRASSGNKYVWCAKCRIAIPATDFADHVAATHGDPPPPSDLLLP